MKKLAVYLYSIVLGLWVGGMSLFTFILTPVIFRSYPRDAAGEIVGKLFPAYFLFALAISVASLLLFFSASLERGSLRHRVSLFLISLSVIISLYVNFRLFPEAERIKKQVHSFETSSPEDPARAAFRRLHAQSAVLNLLMIADGLALLIMNVRPKK